MFDLDNAIAEWRRQMAAAGIKNPETLDELESHLRDDVEQQSRSGLSGRQAFEAAVRRIGQAAALKCEFEKARPSKCGRKLKLLKGIVGVLLAGLAVLAGASAVFHVEMTLGRQLLAFAAVASILLSICAWRYVVRLLSASLEAPEGSAFTPGAKQILEFARAEAPLLRHDFIGTEHVLLGLLSLETGVVSSVLRKSGVDHEGVRTEIEKLVGIGPDHATAVAIPYTPRARKALQIAAREAKALNQAQVGAEHIFLGLLLEGGGAAALVLKSLGIRIEKIREEILQEMNPSSGRGGIAGS